MSRKLCSYLFILAGVINLINSIICFKIDRMSWGAVYLSVGAALIALGVVYWKKFNKK